GPHRQRSLLFLDGPLLKLRPRLVKGQVLDLLSIAMIATDDLDANLVSDVEGDSPRKAAADSSSVPFAIDPAFPVPRVSSLIYPVCHWLSPPSRYQGRRWRSPHIRDYDLR